jgi:hypothetical protein
MYSMCGSRAVSVVSLDLLPVLYRLDGFQAVGAADSGCAGTPRPIGHDTPVEWFGQ